jgi:hypothetical protein
LVNRLQLSISHPVKRRVHVTQRGTVFLSDILLALPKLNFR